MVAPRFASQTADRHRQPPASKSRMSDHQRVRRNCSPCRKRRKGGCGSEDAISNKGCQGRAPCVTKTGARPVDNAEAQKRPGAVSEHRQEDAQPSSSELADPQRLFTDIDKAAVSALKAAAEAEKRPRGTKGKRKRRQHTALPCSIQSSKVCWVTTVL